MLALCYGHACIDKISSILKQKAFGCAAVRNVDGDDVKKNKLSEPPVGGEFLFFRRRHSHLGEHSTP
jgi:hypothetical protein